VGKRCLIDSNILLEYIGNLLPENASGFINEVLSEDFNISVINAIEVLGHHSATKDVADFLDLANQFELSQQVVKETTNLRILYKIKLPDAIIAATAIVHNFVLLSRNVKDFEKINGLKFSNPHTI
jgi:predicted nucleic acid-binding protein